MILQHNTQLERIVFSDESVIILGDLGVIDIQVQMQNGQMAPVPWFEVLYEDGKQQLWNAAHCEGITLLKKALED